MVLLFIILQDVFSVVHFTVGYTATGLVEMFTKKQKVYTSVFLGVGKEAYDVYIIKSKGTFSDAGFTIAGGVTYGIQRIYITRDTLMPRSRRRVLQPLRKLF